MTIETICKQCGYDASVNGDRQYNITQFQGIPESELKSFEESSSAILRKLHLDTYPSHAFSKPTYKRRNGLVLRKRVLYRA